MALMYDDLAIARPALAQYGANQKELYEWDRLNAVALSKFKYYLDKPIYNIVWKWENLSALQFYHHLNQMFLHGDMQSQQLLEDAL